MIEQLMRDHDKMLLEKECEREKKDSKKKKITSNVVVDGAKKRNKGKSSVENGGDGARSNKSNELGELSESDLMARLDKSKSDMVEAMCAMLRLKGKENTAEDRKSVEGWIDGLFYRVMNDTKRNEGETSNHVEMRNHDEGEDEYEDGDEDGDESDDELTQEVWDAFEEHFLQSPPQSPPREK